MRNERRPNHKTSKSSKLGIEAILKSVDEQGKAKSSRSIKDYDEDEFAEEAEDKFGEELAEYPKNGRKIQRVPVNLNDHENTCEKSLAPPSLAGDEVRFEDLNNMGKSRLKIDKKGTPEVSRKALKKAKKFSALDCDDDSLGDDLMGIEEAAEKPVLRRGLSKTKSASNVRGSDIDAEKKPRSFLKKARSSVNVLGGDLKGMKQRSIRKLA